MEKIHKGESKHVRKDTWKFSWANIYYHATTGLHKMLSHSAIVRKDKVKNYSRCSVLLAPSCRCAYLLCSCLICAGLKPGINLAHRRDPGVEPFAVQKVTGPSSNIQTRASHVCNHCIVVWTPETRLLFCGKTRQLSFNDAERSCYSVSKAS